MGYTFAHLTKKFILKISIQVGEKNILIILGPVGYWPTTLALHHSDIYTQTQDWVTSVGNKNLRNGIKIMKKKWIKN